MSMLVSGNLPIRLHKGSMQVASLQVATLNRPAVCECECDCDYITTVKILTFLAMFYEIISEILPEFFRIIFPEKYWYFSGNISGKIPKEISGNFLTHIPNYSLS